MGAHLVTGYAGKEHITSADQGTYNAGTIGKGKYVLETGRMFECEQINSNLVKIHSGDLMNQGRHIKIPANDYVECQVDNGLQGLKRNDLIVMRYRKNKDTDIENAEVVVLKGTSGETAIDPEHVSGDILNGDTEDDFLLYRVRLNGIEIEGIETLFHALISSEKMQNKIDGMSEDFSGKYQKLDTSLKNMITDSPKITTPGKYALDACMSNESIEGSLANSIKVLRNKCGSSLHVSGKTVSLKNASGTVLSTIETQDTTYNLASMVINIRPGSKSATVGATTYEDVSIAYTVPAGYRISGIGEIASGNHKIVVGGYKLSSLDGSGTLTVYLFNMASSSQSANVSANLILVKTAF